MNTTQPDKVSGPYTHQNLDIYLFHGADTLDTSGYVTLEEGLAQEKVVVHETGDVGQLEVENLFVDKDLLILTGEIVRGGRQDRLLGVDLIVSRRSGRVPLPSFCVESARWNQRGCESDHTFSDSKHYLSSKHLKRAARIDRDQGEVWDEVAKTQASCSKSLGETVCADASPSSLELTLEHKKVKERRRAYRKALRDLAGKHPDAVGFAFAINGELSSAELYPSHDLFRRYWEKQLNAAADEALAESWRQEKPSKPLSSAAVQALIDRARTTPPRKEQVTRRVTVWTRQAKDDYVFETHDTAHDNEVGIVHTHYLHAVSTA